MPLSIIILDYFIFFYLKGSEQAQQHHAQQMFVEFISSGFYTTVGDLLFRRQWSKQFYGDNWICLFVQLKLPIKWLVIFDFSMAIQFLFISGKDIEAREDERGVEQSSKKNS